MNIAALDIRRCTAVLLWSNFREEGEFMYATENKITGWNLVIAFTALFIGGLFGPLQKLQNVGINAYPTLNSLGIKTYYQGLTLHGVLNALVYENWYIRIY